MKKEISKLHVITQDRSDKTHLDQIVNVCKGGAQWVQLRVKNVDNLIWTEIAKDAKKICHQFGTKLIVNDSPGLVKEVGADGVHLGKQDMNPLEARNMLGEDVIIGGPPDYFTPNGDGYHDTWHIVRRGEFRDARIYIFDRYGKLLKQLDPGGNGWDGTYNGNPLPSSDYWYRIELSDGRLVSGNFTLKR